MTAESPQREIELNQLLHHLHLHIELPQEFRLHLEANERAGAKTNGAAAGGSGDALAVPRTAYFLQGDGVPLLTAEHRDLLARTASLLTGQVVRVVVATGPAESTAVTAVPVELEPVPAIRDDFRQFGRQYGYEQTRAGRAWNRVYYTAREDNESKEQCGLPAIRYVGITGCPHPFKRDESILDVRSVAERLEASGCRPGAWDGGTKAHVAFLVHMVREWVGADVLPGLVVTPPAAGETTVPRLKEAGPGVEPNLLPKYDPEPDRAPEPIPVTLEDLRRFAREHGYSKHRAGRIWNTLFHTSMFRDDEQGGLPAIRYLDGLNERTLDLHSVSERLAASEGRHEVWWRANEGDVRFLGDLVKEWDSVAKISEP